MDLDREQLYKELADEKDLVKKLKYFDNQITSLENSLKTFYDSDIYSELDLEDKIKYDIFLSYSLTSLQWMYTRTLGEDPSSHPVKEEVGRIQEFMALYHNIRDRKKAPHINKEAAKRFIRSGLYDPNTLKPCKRKVFDDNAEPIGAVSVDDE